MAPTFWKRRWGKKKSSVGNSQNTGNKPNMKKRRPLSKFKKFLNSKNGASGYHKLTLQSIQGKHRLRDTWDIGLVVWNVEGKGSPEEIDKSIKKSLNKTPKIVCLQEANLPKDSTTTENFVWHCSGTFGSAVLIKKELANVEVISFESVCEQICVVELKHENTIIKVISCCIPPSTNYVCADVWEKLISVVKAIPTHTTYVLAGDFNAEVGKRDSHRVACGGFGDLVYHENSNENGIKLIEFVRIACLRVSNTFKPSNVKTPMTHFTYVDGETKYQRSYVILPKNRNAISWHNFINRWNPDYKHAIMLNEIKIIKSDRVVFGLKEEDEATEGKLEINTWNVSGASPAKVDTILTEQKLDIVCIQEVFLTSAEDLNTENYNWYSMAKPWAKNVAIVVKKSPRINVEGFKAVSESLCVGDVVYKDKTVKIICCYLPLPNDPKNEALKNQLTELIKSIPKNSLFVLAGDFNVNLSNKKPSEGNTEDDTDNTTFLSKLAEENDLCMELTLYNYWAKYKVYLNSRMTSTQVSRPHQILMPKDHRVLKLTKLFTKWIPFSENAILSLFMVDLNCKALDKQIDVVRTDRTEIVDGKLEKIRELNCFEPKEIKEENLISEEDHEKFKSTPPSAEELGRLLNDFVIFYTPNVKPENGLIASTINVLVDSFREAGKFGKFLVEDVEIYSLPDDKPINRECRIKWQGILLAQLTGKYSEHNLKIMKHCGENLIASLGQTCYTVKPKRVFFNKGFEPAYPKDEKLNEIFRMVSKKDYPTMPEVMTHIEEFLGTDTDCELAFGPEFTKEELSAIKQYAEEHKLGSRFFTLAADVKHSDHIAIFNRRTPQEIRDRAIEIGNDHKYFLIRPCGLREDYTKLALRADLRQLKKESKIYSAFWDAVTIPKQPSSGDRNKVNASTQPKSETNVKQEKERNERKPLRRKMKVKVQNTQEPAPRLQNKIPPQSRRDQQNERPPQSRRDQQNERPPQSRWNQQNKRPPQSRWDQQNKRPPQAKWDQQNKRPPQSKWDQQNKRPPQSRWDQLPREDVIWKEERQPQRRYEDQSQDNRSLLSDSYSQGRSYREENHHNERGRMQEDRYFEGERRNQDRYIDRERINEDGYGRRDTNYDNSQFQTSLFDTEYPPAKRLKQSQAPARNPLPPVNPPQWHLCAPLIVVWPVTMQSQIEDRSHIILEENFPTEYIKNEYGVAVMVTLPMHNGNQKEFCLSVEYDQKRATSDALDLIVKHSTVIKPSPTYLCDGSAPNFIRYNVPCQTNPRTYIIVTKNDTGPLVEEIVHNILLTFQESYNEDVFFDNYSFTFQEKVLLMEMAPKYQLKVRHFGDAPGVVNRWVCIYKKRPKEQILEEVLKMRGNHPKYMITTDRLPPRVGLNIF